jgi:hypothetical protein
MTGTASLLSAALTAAGRGWHVFPLRPNDKRPAFPDHTTKTCTGRDPRCRAAAGHVGWEPRATTDPDRIRRAWSAAPFNIGVASGPSGLIVIDLDQPKPGKPRPAAWDIEGVRDGADVLAVLCGRAGQPYPADTHTVRTGSDGTHLIFGHPGWAAVAQHQRRARQRARLAHRHPRARRATSSAPDRPCRAARTSPRTLATRGHCPAGSRPRCAPLTAARHPRGARWWSDSPVPDAARRI